MRDQILKISFEYRKERKNKFAGNQLADFIRKNFRRRVDEIVSNQERYLVDSSPGKSQWTDTPWLAIFDRFVTTSAQNGYYPVFIFRDDMSGLYLTLNQGITEIRESHKKNAINKLKINAEAHRARIGRISSNFTEKDIILKLLPTTNSDLPKFYQAGNIIAKFYSITDLPSNEVFEADIHQILEIYKALVYSEDKMILSDETNIRFDTKGFEKKQFRQHTRIERNQSLIKKVKKAQGYTCKACELNFTDKYGELGREFIEAHHLKPISELKEDIVELDAYEDFIVLCSNCHRMIHKMDDPSDLKSFKLMIKVKN